MPLLDPTKIFPFVLLAIFLLVGIALLRVCVEDARKRGKSPLLVCLLVFGFFPMGFLLWLLFRPAKIENDTPRPFHLEDHRVQ